MLLLIDYGIGNVRSLEKAFRAVGAKPVRSADPTDIARADQLVLPGVGAFGACANELRRHGLWAPVRMAAEAGTPILGVCVGMQLLFEASEEMGEHAGLDLLPGRVVRFDGTRSNGRPLKVPHMGWNTVRATRPSPLLSGIAFGRALLLRPLVPRRVRTRGRRARRYGLRHSLPRHRAARDHRRRAVPPGKEPGRRASAAP